MDSPELEYLSFGNYVRRFGVEIEVNAFDGASKPLGDVLPTGMHYVAELVKRVTNSRVDIFKWHHTHHNNAWLIKPDSSCGMEVCSPVSKGWHGLKTICEVADALSNDHNIKADERCSLHVHVEVADLSQEQLATVLAYWVKCEPIFLDAFNSSRKVNTYCRLLSQSDIFEHDMLIPSEQLIRKFGYHKYFTLNTFHLIKDKRDTIEFRLAENAFCKNSFGIKNWVRLLIHFVEMVKKLPNVGAYMPGNKWSSYLWLDPIDLFSILGWDYEAPKYKLSPGMEQCRNWFLGRLMSYTQDPYLLTVFSTKARSVAYEQTKDLYEKHAYLADLNKDLYDEKFRV